MGSVYTTMAEESERGTPADIGDLSFLIGEWRGKAKMSSDTAQTGYSTHMVCLKSPGGNGAHIIQFDDDPERESMFYAEHLEIYHDKTSGGLKARMEGYAFSDMGDTVLVMNENVTKTAEGIRFKSDPESKNMLRNDVVFSRSGDNGLKLKGTTSAGSNTWETEFDYIRRKAK